LTGHRRFTFELLGFDIMLDENLKPYLIEVNTNPGTISKVENIDEIGLHLLTDVVIPHHTNAVVDILKGTFEFLPLRTNL
jgi:hypothetical protein